jgi:hypothetical protein
MNFIDVLITTIYESIAKWLIKKVTRSGVFQKYWLKVKYWGFTYLMVVCVGILYLVSLARPNNREFNLKVTIMMGMVLMLFAFGTMYKNNPPKVVAAA